MILGVFPAGAGVIRSRMVLYRCVSVFPAGAGVILKQEVQQVVSRRFPRRCGGDPGGLPSVFLMNGFSPQVRG